MQQARGVSVGDRPCGRGCSIRANYQSTTVHLPPALATGNLDIVTDAMVNQVVLGRNGLAKGVKYIDKISGKERLATARVVVLAASACETVRILLNSRSAQFPEGLANSSGKVGRYLMDTVGSSLRGQVPLLESLPPQNEDGASGHAFYAPWWLYQDQQRPASWASRAAITSSSAAAGACRNSARCAASNTLRAEATARSSKTTHAATTVPLWGSRAAAR